MSLLLVGLTQGTLPGIPWFEPWDKDKPAVKVRIEAPPALALTPLTLPPKVSGMAWFARWTTDPVTKPQTTLPSTFFVPFALRSNRDIPWTQRWSVDPVTKPVYSIPPVYTEPKFQNRGIPWTQRWSIDPVTKPVFSNPHSFTGYPVTVTGMDFQKQWDHPVYTKPTYTIPEPWSYKILLGPQTVADKDWFHDRWSIDPSTKPTFTLESSHFLTPFGAPVPVSGMAWFEPRDIDKKAIKVTLEAVLQWKWGTVFTPVSGMAWWEVRDNDKKATKVTVESSPAWDPRSFVFRPFYENTYDIPQKPFRIPEPPPSIRKFTPFLAGTPVSGIAWLNTDYHKNLPKRLHWVDEHRPPFFFIRTRDIFTPPEDDFYRPFSKERRNVKSHKLPLMRSFR